MPLPAVSWPYCNKHRSWIQGLYLFSFPDWQGATCTCGYYMTLQGPPMSGSEATRQPKRRWLELQRPPKTSTITPHYHKGTPLWYQSDYNYSSLPNDDELKSTMLTKNGLPALQHKPFTTTIGYFQMQPQPRNTSLALYQQSCWDAYFYGAFKGMTSELRHSEIDSTGFSGKISNHSSSITCVI